MIMIPIQQVSTNLISTNLKNGKSKTHQPDDFTISLVKYQPYYLLSHNCPLPVYFIGDLICSRVSSFWKPSVIIHVQTVYLYVDGKGA